MQESDNVLHIHTYLLYMVWAMSVCMRREGREGGCVRYSLVGWVGLGHMELGHYRQQLWWEGLAVDVFFILKLVV